MRCPHLIPALALLLGLAGSTPPARAAAQPATGPWTAAHDASPAFTPDGATVVFTRGSGTARRLYVAHRHGDGWSTPVSAPFSNRWMDFEPAMAPDGRYLVFVSNRPAHGGDKPLDGRWGGHDYPGRGGNLWRVDRRDGGWGTPRRLPDGVNAGGSTFSPAVAADGSLYFVRVDPAHGAFRLYRSHYADGRYQAAQALELGGGATVSDYDPTVARDQSFLVFSSDRPPASPNGGDLFIAFATPEGWSAPVDLGVAGDEARLGADRHTLYYSAPDHRIHRLSLARWLAR
jgi:Tol biopolymer transport system component